VERTTRVWNQGGTDSTITRCTTSKTHFNLGNGGIISPPPMAPPPTTEFEVVEQISNFKNHYYYENDPWLQGVLLPSVLKMISKI
jgi:hypothetical protein